MKNGRILGRIIWVAVALIVLGASAWALRPRPVTVQSARATRGALTSTVGGEGKTEVRARYVVSAPVDGELERIEARPGDRVTRDAVVARIRPGAARPLDSRSRAEAVAGVAVARAAVARADAAQAEAAVALEHARSLLATNQNLAHSGTVAASEAIHGGHEAEIRRDALDEAIAGARQARADLARAQAVLLPGNGDGQATLVMCPASGSVLRVIHDNAGPVAAGTPLVEIGDVSQLEVVADLLSVDAALVRAGAAATITGWGGRQALHAQVRRVDPAAFTKVSALGLEEQRVHVVLDFAEPVPPGLGHDYRVDVAIVVWQGENVLRVPSTALFRSGDSWAVFVIVDERAHLVNVDPGLTDGTLTAIDHGLAEGDRVVVQPSDEIQEGVRVR
jgi:HlyD family secretion protein